MGHAHKLAWVVLMIAALGCGGDDGGEKPEAGAGGSKAGAGGSKAGAGGAMAGNGADAGVDQACVDTALENAGGEANIPCAECACGIDADATNACDKECWALVICVRDKCNSDGDDTVCITKPNAEGGCYDEVIADDGNGIQATMFKPTIEMCTDICNN